MNLHTMTEHRLLKPVFAILMIMLGSSSASAFSIESVTVVPAGPIGPNDSVTLEILIVTPTLPALLYQPTEVVVTGNDILVDIFPDSGPLSALSSVFETVDLGTFQPGTYEYTVVLNPAFDKNWGTRRVTGSLSVAGEHAIPSVSAWGLVVMALLMLTTGSLLFRIKAES